MIIGHFLPAGVLKDRVVFQVGRQEVTGGGEPRREWVDFVSLWCHIEQQGAGTEQDDYERVSAQRRMLVTIRYTPGINTAMRAVFRGRIWQIVGVDHLTHSGVASVVEVAESAADPNSAPPVGQSSSPYTQPNQQTAGPMVPEGQEPT